MSDVELKPDWQLKCLEATRYNESRFGTILMAAFGVKSEDPPWFASKAVVTSDGFIMCSFTTHSGDYHMGAFVGSERDLWNNVQGLADHLGWNDEDSPYCDLVAAINMWLGK